MAVVISTEDGCVLDHDIAIATVYRHCVSAASSSVSTLSSAHAESVGQLHILHQQSTEPSKEISPDQMCGDRCNVAQNPVILASTGFVSQHATDSNSPVQSTDVLTSSSDSAPVFNFEHPASESEPAGKNHPHRTLGRSEITGVEHHSRQLETVPEAAQVQVEVKGSEQEACVSRDNSCVRLCQLAEAESTVCLYKTPASDPEDESGSASTENDKQQVSEDKTESTIAANKLLPSQCNVHKETSGTCRPSKSDQWKNSVEKCDVFESKTQRVSLRLKHGFFTVNVPFMMDSQFEKVRRCLAQDSTLHRACGDSINTADIQNIVSKKKTKRKAEKKTLSSDEERLLRVLAPLVHAGKQQGIFQQCLTQPLDNNLLSRQCAQLDRHADVLTNLLVTGEGLPIYHVGDCRTPLKIISGDSAQFSAVEMIHRRVSQDWEEPLVVNIDGAFYVLPPSSEFILSNLQDLCDHLHLEFSEDGYDLIVLDPPWENKSVKRKKSYLMMSEEELQDLPMSRLTRPGALVAVWVTNNERLEEFCVHTLFPLWGLTALARWHWLKVTRTGDLICSMDEGHKKPYEILLLARAVPDKTAVAAAAAAAAVGSAADVPGSKVIVSVPCSLHSKKPPLAELLRPYLPSQPRCLELFARNLWPGWTSWGREALKHQNLVFYDVEETSD